MAEATVWVSGKAGEIVNELGTARVRVVGWRNRGKGREAEVVATYTAADWFEEKSNEFPERWKAFAAAKAAMKVRAELDK